MTRSFALGLTLLALSSSAIAQDGSPVGVVTGSASGTYIQFGKDMRSASSNAGLNLLVKESKGSLDNIRRMVSSENAAAGVVQSDVLGFLARSEDSKMRRVAEKLRLVFPFYNEEIHLFARKEIKSLKDLSGKRVVLGTNGSGNWLTATNILHVGKVEPSERLRLAPVEAATAVLTGKADAMFFVGGKPVKLFQNFNDLKSNPQYSELLKQVHMVPLRDEALLEEYEEGSLSPDEYSWLDEPVPTIAVKAVLVAFDFSSRQSNYYKARCNQLQVLGKAIRDGLPTLKSTGHPKWGEVELEQNVGIWKQDDCSRVNLASSETSSEDDFLIKGLQSCIETGNCK